jgi:hypothetical protein
MCCAEKRRVENLFRALLYHLQNALPITPRLQKFRLRIRRVPLSQPF